MAVADLHLRSEGLRGPLRDPSGRQRPQGRRAQPLGVAGGVAEAVGRPPELVDLRDPEHGGGPMELRGVERHRLRLGKADGILAVVRHPQADDPPAAPRPERQHAPDEERRVICVGDDQEERPAPAVGDVVRADDLWLGG